MPTSVSIQKALTEHSHTFINVLPGAAFKTQLRPCGPQSRERLLPGPFREAFSFL